MGFVYALIAAGLSLIFGLMEIVNFAHGEFLMLAMFSTYWAWALWRLDPVLSLPLTAAVLFLLGFATYHGLIRWVLGAPMLAQIFATFGLAIFLRSAAQAIWGVDFHLVKDPLVQGRISLGGLFIGLPQLVASVGALLAFVFLNWFISRTETGLALQATAQDRQAASLMGILRLPRRGRELRPPGLCDGGARRLRQRAGHPGGGGDRGGDRGAGRAPHRAGAQVRGRLRPLPAGRPLAASGIVRALLMPRPFALAAGLVALALLLAFPLVFTLPYPRDVMIRIFLYAMLATAWNVLAGYCGQISLGHAVFFGTGAYTSTVLVKTLGLSPWAGMLAGAALAVALSQVIGYPVFRLRGHYFAIATIAVGEIVQTLTINWDWVGGARGLFVPIDRTCSLLAFQFRDKQV